MECHYTQYDKATFLAASKGYKQRMKSLYFLVLWAGISKVKRLKRASNKDSCSDESLTRHILRRDHENRWKIRARTKEQLTN